MTKINSATFAGGCFWCIHQALESLPGVIKVTSGYTGGDIKFPKYKQVSSGKTSHLEAVQIKFDSDIISYETLLDFFMRQTDPTDPEGQFVDKGPQYRSAIFYHDTAQKKSAEKYLKSLSKHFTKPIVTLLLPAKPFYPAENYHQNYHKKNPAAYKAYKSHSGRASRLKDLWGKDLSPLQFDVTQNCSTEPAFKNKYWDHFEEGIYVDIISGEPLFSSKSKFQSQSGWPSFTQPIKDTSIKESKDTSQGMLRTEVKSSKSLSHLGHVFDDGPKPSGKRYCINSASLKFIPKKDLAKAGYKEYLSLFD